MTGSFILSARVANSKLAAKLAGDLIRVGGGQGIGVKAMVRRTSGTLAKRNLPASIIIRMNWSSSGAANAARLTAPVSGQWRDFPAGNLPGFGIAIKRLKQSARCLCPRFQVFSSPFIRAHKVTRGDTQWNEKVFPNPTKLLSRST